MDTFGATYASNWGGRNIDDSSFTLHDRLALLEHNMLICDNANISLSLSEQIYVSKNPSIYFWIIQWNCSWAMSPLSRDSLIAHHRCASPVYIITHGPLARYVKLQVVRAPGMPGTFSPAADFQRKPLVSDPGMHHGTCVTHVPWCMSGSLTRSGGENVPGIPGACAPAILRIWEEAHANTHWELHGSTNDQQWVSFGSWFCNGAVNIMKLSQNKFTCRFPGVNDFTVIYLISPHEINDWKHYL